MFEQGGHSNYQKIQRTIQEHYKKKTLVFIDSKAKYKRSYYKIQYLKHQIYTKIFIDLKKDFRDQWPPIFS